MNGPTVRRRRFGSTRRTANPPRSLLTGSTTMSTGPGSPGSLASGSGQGSQLMADLSADADTVAQNPLLTGGNAHQPRLGLEVALEPGGIGCAVPWFDAQQVGIAPRPDAELAVAAPRHLDLRRLRTAVAQAVARGVGHDDRVGVEQRRIQMQRVALDRRGHRIGQHKTVGVEPA